MTVTIASSGLQLRRRVRDAALASVVVVIGLSGTLLAYRASSETERVRTEELRNASARAVLDSFQLDLTRTVEAVRNAALMIESHPNLHRAQFNAYSERLMAKLDTLTFLEWQPVVPQARLRQFELSARAEGLANYRVVQPDGDGWVAAHGRTEYVPVLYGWPEQPAALGVDMAFDPARMESKLRSRVVGRPVASGSFKIIHSGAMSADAMAFAISAPVYQGDARATPGQKLSGYVAAVIGLNSLLQDAAGRADAASLDLLVFDLTDGKRQRLYAHRGNSPDPQPGTDNDSPVGALDKAIAVDVAMRSWEIVLRPRPGFAAASPDKLAPATLFAGLAATLLLTLAVLRVQRSRRRTELAQLAAQQARDLLAVERQRLQNIIDGTDAGTWEVNLQTGELRVNRQWLGMLGHTGDGRGLVSLQTWHAAGHPDEHEAMQGLQRRLAAGELDIVEYETRRRHKDGHWVWVLTRGRVISHTPDGRPEWVAGINQDISARKQAERQIVELNNTLEQRVQERSAQLESAMQTLQRSHDELARSEARATLGTLVASVSHEMNTPMGNSMMTASTLVDQAREFTRLLGTGQLKRSDLATFVTRVQDGSALLLRNLERAADLLNNFRQVAADQASEQRRVFDLRQVVSEVLDTLAPSLKGKPHRIVLEVPAGIRMDSYPGPIGQVLINLINNADLHAFEGISNGVFTIAAVLEHGSVKLTCSDNGRGMEPATLDKLFEPFFSTKIGQGGTGLGMAIVHNLVHKTLDGTLAVSSTPGAGTSFTIHVPIEAPRMRHDEPP